jgi:hypothetical protein
MNKLLVMNKIKPTISRDLNVIAKPWTALEEDNIAFLLPTPKCTNCIKPVLMLELSKTDT